MVAEENVEELTEIKERIEDAISDLPIVGQEDEESVE